MISSLPSSPSLPGMNRTVVIVASVVLLHLGALWALHSGLLRRMVETVVPVEVLSDLITPPAPRADVPPAPAPATPAARTAPRPAAKAAPQLQAVDQIYIVNIQSLERETAVIREWLGPRRGLRTLHLHHRDRESQQIAGGGEQQGFMVVQQFGISTPVTY